ncbi:MAG: SDR family NAD(P)-dependent oxidoreductase [Paracoccaceae bacterium]|nr:SDR family NAD(P)-dependent oxidoreductase [Paracoccaceae bacterium]
MQKTALITGAARGIGLATAEIFQANGYRVAILDRDAQALSAAAAQLPQAEPILFDLALPETAAEVARQIEEKFGALDALVNNAGVADFGPIEDCDRAMWRKVMDTNLDGMFHLTQALTPQLKAGTGSVVNIASISGLRASTLRVAYGTSKAAVMQLSKQQAVELGEYGIRVNCVAPGPVRTKLAMAVHTQDIIDAYHDAIPLNRYGQEHEIGEVIYFLCSQKASFVTGQVIAVDGGFEATGVGLPALRR